ncbi:MAG: OmpA family protein [Flavobacteriales bacterium]
MKILSYVFIAVLATTSWGQDYKWKYANTLSMQYRYAEALPVWEEIAEKAQMDGIRLTPSLRKTVEAAYQSENYAKAVKWSKVLVTKGQTEPRDWLIFMNALQYMNLNQRLSGVLDSALVKHPLDASLMQKKKNLSSVYANLTLSSDHVVRVYKEGSEGEEFGAFPYNSGVLFVTNEFNNHAINRNYPRTGQFYTDIATYDSLEAEKTKTFKFYEKPFWLEFIFKNRWKALKSTKGHDGPVSFDPSYSYMFITSNFEQKDVEGKMKYARLKQRFFGVRSNGFDEIEFPFNSIDFSTGHATMDAEGNVYFVSNRPGSMIKSIVFDTLSKKMDTIFSADIWKTKYTDGEWSDPVNMGDKVNTTEDELFPFISSKGILYFSSYGWNGIGGLDIFMSELDGVAPEPLGSPLNSHADDFSYYVNEETGKGYFASNRNAFKDQLFAFNKPVFAANLSAQLTDCKGKGLGSQTVVIKDLRNGKVETRKTDRKGQIGPLEVRKKHSYAIRFAGDKGLTPDSTVFNALDTGSFTVTLKTYFRDNYNKLSVLNESDQAMEGVMLTVYRERTAPLKFQTDASATYIWKNEKGPQIDSIVANFINYNDGSIAPKKWIPNNCIDTNFYTIKMVPKPKEEFIFLDLILYDFDKFDLRPESLIELDKLVKYMQIHPDLKVELSSHTDCRGTSAYNEKLSQERARSCIDYIISQGINPESIIAMGYGESMLKNDCPCEKEIKSNCSDEEHQANRRTELKLLTPENKPLDNQRLED